MTATELQSIVRRLANQCHCRYWLNFFNSQTDVKMAIQCLEFETMGLASPIRMKCLEEKGFQLYASKLVPLDWIYVIERTNDDGTPFESKLLYP